MDPAEEVLLDPVLVNPLSHFNRRGKRAIPVPTALFEVSVLRRRLKVFAR